MAVDTYTQVKDITVNITTASAAGSVGLGFPLVVAGMSAKVVPYTECNSLTDVVTAGFVTDTEVYKACAAIFAQKNRPITLAVASTDGKVAEWVTANKDKGFRQIVPILGDGDSTTAELVTAVSALDDKMLFLECAAVEAIPEVKSERVVCVVYGSESEYVNAAVVGASAGMAAGSFTYKNLVLTGIVPEDLNLAEVEAVHEAGGMCIIKKAGDVVTSEGKTTDGEYIDIVDSRDYIISNIVYQGQKALNNNAKLPFDNVGISQLENMVVNVLADAYRQGIIATDSEGLPAYSTNFATREEVPASDRVDRTYKGGSFTFDLAGAIHNATINGTLVV